ncbi:MAG TPA: hypothetical protein VNO81_05445 [Candidatus Nitrosotenuis sp.]|jgi:hypothetical protein|nr:hypothetical protein [Candidatus Nitrosotenuis sp.]
MAQDHRDKIEQIRARRGGGGWGRDSVQIGVTPYDPTPQVGQVGISETGDKDPMALLGADFKSPWLRDRVTLSLEGQIAMIEARSTYGINMVDLGYSNRISILQIRPGIYVKLEPTGCYRLTYHNR